jgi:competence protein ComEC
VALGGSSIVAAGIVVWWRRQTTREPPPPRVTAAAPGARPGSRSAGRHGVAARLATLGLALAVAVTTAVAISRPPGVARITVLDVGQGDAILVEGSRGGRLLIDGGPDPDRLLVELDRRIPPWDRRIDAVILSHPHEDHVAGLALLLERYRVARVMEPGMRGPGPGYAAWLEALAQPGAPLRLAVGAGDRLAVDEIAMQVLWPIRADVPSEPPDSGTGINNVSVVLLGAIGNRRFLLAGDVEEEIDPQLLAGGLPQLDFLKVAHHGSRTATTEPFVAAVRPRIAVASAGADNTYGHPARSTMDRLAAVGSRVLRTDRDGTVAVAFEAVGMTVRTEPRRGMAARSSRVAAVAPAGPSGPSRAFGCAVPDPSAVAEADPVRDRPGAADTGPDLGWRDGGLGYHRIDDGPWPRGSRCAALLARSAQLVRRARPGGGRGRGLPGGPARGQRDLGGSWPGGGRGLAPRRRQDPATGRPGPGPPPRLGFGEMADGPRPRGARPAGRGPPGDAAGGR